MDSLSRKLPVLLCFFVLFLFVFFLFSIHTRLVCTHYTLQEKNNNSSHLIVGHNYNNSFAINHQTNGQWKVVCVLHVKWKKCIFPEFIIFSVTIVQFFSFFFFYSFNLFRTFILLASFSSCENYCTWARASSRRTK